MSLCVRILLMDLSVVIVNYNTRELLRRCLETVFASEGLSFRVCVVDNASSDESAAMVAREFPDVLLLPTMKIWDIPLETTGDYRRWDLDVGK